MEKFFNPLFAAEVGGIGATAELDNDIWKDLYFDKHSVAKLRERSRMLWNVEVSVAEGQMLVKELLEQVQGTPGFQSWVSRGGRAANEPKPVEKREEVDYTYSGCSFQSDLLFIKIIREFMPSDMEGKITKVRISFSCRVCWCSLVRSPQENSCGNRCWWKSD